MTLTLTLSELDIARQRLLRFERSMAQKYSTRRFASRYLLSEQATHNVLRRKLRDALHRENGFTGYIDDPSMNVMTDDDFENIVPVVGIPTGKRIVYPMSNVIFQAPELKIIEADPEPEDEFSAAWLMWSMRRDG